ncbi:Segregation and condensation protein A [bioreactor metagenome]|uniref:Segregation and condensation protein A n=1 Tax=bioreactor metagenome TaxID=1076179 RepID=A0A644XVL0_9ZZZZ
MAYLVQLKQFEGPLDLLLHLIEEAEVDVKDIFVSEITAQYLSYMAQVDELDMDTASEFLTMAATLLYIKSRQLLPRPPKEDEAEEDPEELLIRQLREYKAFKEATEQLRQLFEAAQDGKTRLPEDVPLPPKEVTLDGASMDGLFSAFLVMLERKKDEPERIGPPQVRPDRYTVRTQTGKIRTILQQKAAVFFEELFESNTTRMEMIVTFMALLEMIARGEILLKQSAPFAPIRISADKLLLDDETYEYMDESED